MRYIKRYRQQIYAILILLIVATLQSTLLNYFRIFSVKPDIILISLIIMTAFFSLAWSVFFAFILGIFRDIFSILPFGFNVIILIIWIILAKQITRRLSIEHKFIRCIIPCLIILLNNIAWQSISFMLGRPVFIGPFLKIASLEFVFTLVLVLPIYRLIVHLFDSFFPQKSF